MLRVETTAFLERHGLVVDPSRDEQQVVDPEVIRLLVDSLGILPGDVVLEVGPGAGNITIELVRSGANVVCVEKDPKWLPVLRERLAGTQTEAVIGDALTAMLPRFDRVVSNLPYSIAEAFIHRLTKLKFVSAAFLVPASFAATLTAHEGDPAYSKLSLIVGLFFGVSILESVPAEAYFPPPRTRTSMITVSSRQPAGPVEAVMRELLRQGDKKLGNALIEAMIRCAPAYGTPRTKKSAKAALAEVLNDLDPERRVGRLPLGDLKRLEPRLGALLGPSS